MRKITRVKRSYTMSLQADELLKRLAIKNGVSKSAILEICIRNEAKSQNVSEDVQAQTEYK